MLCQIYFGMFLVVTPLCQSSESYNEDILGLATQTVSDALVRLDECLGNMERIKNERIREKLLKTNNKTSFQKLNYDDKSFSVPKEIQPIIEKIFPDLTSIYSIKDVLENFEKINYTDTTNIIPKLKQFKENEYISLLNFLQILAGKYYKIPKQMVELFNNLFEGFHDKDTLKTRLISLDDFKSVLENVLNNDDVKKNILKAFKDIENVYYEAWLLKKRKDINSITFRSCYLKLLYKEDKHKSNSLT
ncbi:uncharacterized protein LOC126906537 isoform X3 [Daktulosphaira vitifoliae]|uniref:uncharacterized protein LOC126906537 isoform X2 n=1 Tax=Daktulosphaira vitifoliae TaxID=58002 RepID=UPI0021A9A43D|nr:uncharacterized protein LOC126906537 isoform X2 [Daktulosphaira vitifoliae]XP_050543065.1 uncharacterized protein LOC126906537 isoform X3 [Daktulosphaira vitifoliae]